jgi:hypothetical protein
MKEPTTEIGADGKPQLVIPGAERSPMGRVAQVRADMPLKPKQLQKPADIGLFGDSMNQSDLLDVLGGGQ